MMPRWIHAVLLLALAPAAALAAAFETVDTLPYPSDGRFPAWRADPERPWSVFAYGGLMYDSNPFRLSTAGESDMVARLGFGGRSVTRIAGRQRLLLEGFGEYYDYQDFNEIDHFGYGLRGDWLWEIGNQVDGVVRYTRRKRHADLGEFQTVERTMITEEALIVDGGYRFSPRWRIFAGAEHARDKREGDDLEWLNATSLRGGLTYRSPLANEIGVEVVGTRGEARVDVPVGADEASFIDDYDQAEVAVTLAYALGAQWKINGRVGYLDRGYDTLSGRDFNGTSYRVLVEWLPTPSVIFSLEGYRVPQSLADVTATHVLTEGGALGVSWAATFKLVFSARYIYEDLLYKGDPDAVRLGLGDREDTVQTWRLGAGWELQRHLQIGLGFDYGERTSNISGGDYDYEQVMLNVRWKF
jgi:Putative beta-barrel porin 2